MTMDENNAEEIPETPSCNCGCGANHTTAPADNNPFDMKNNPSNMSFDDEKNGSLMLGTILALGAAMLGGLAWALVAHYTNREFGYLAWGIGALVGFAMLKGNKQGSVKAGILAVVLSLSGILLGKLILDEMAYTSDETVKNILNDKENRDGILATGHYLIMREEEPMSEPCQALFDGVLLEGAGGFPEEMTDEQNEIMEKLRVRIEEKSHEKKAAAIKRFMQYFADNTPLTERIQGTLSAYDIIFALLAMVTSFKLASGKE